MVGVQESYYRSKRSIIIVSSDSSDNLFTVRNTSEVNYSGDEDASSEEAHSEKKASSEKKSSFSMRRFGHVGAMMRVDTINNRTNIEVCLHFHPNLTCLILRIF